MTASAPPPAKSGSLFASLFGRATPPAEPVDPDITEVPADPAAQITASTPAHAARQPDARKAQTTATPAPVAGPSAKQSRGAASPAAGAPVPAPNPTQVATVPEPQAGDAPADKPKRPFWKIWDN